MAVRLVRRPDGAPPAGEPKPIVESGTRIGRSLECDLVLDDALRLVSRQHAWLAPAGRDAALLRCISTTAAIQVNGEPLAPGAERLVHDGDLLRLGGFEIQVEIAPATLVVSRPVLVAPPVAAPVPVAAAAASPVPVAPRAPMPVLAPVAAPVAAPAVARAGRLDRFFDLDTVPDPLGPASPLPVAQATAVLEAAPPLARAFESSMARAAERARPSEAPAAASAPRAEPAPPVSAPLPVPPANPAFKPNPALQALRQAFLHGAGLDDDAEFQIDPAWMEHLGALLRASTDGTLGLLRTRAVAKRSIRAENTQIVARENNPLKFAPDAEHALQLLLSLQARRGFLSPVDALRDAHHDLQVHQIAMAAGMRAAVFDLISRLGPEATENDEGPPHGLAASIPALRDASLWRRHKLGHERMLQNLDDLFEATFGREFVKAYEAQARKDGPDEPPAG